MDIVSPATRSRMMAGIRSSNTKAEILLRKLLHAQGFRYRLGTKISGVVPDVVLRKYKTAIFMHGCFWHRHENCKYTTMPKSNLEKWLSKFETNQARDLRTVTRLLAEGWKVVIVWECWYKRGLDLAWLPSWIKEGESQYVSWPEVHDSHIAKQQSAGEACPSASDSYC